MANYVFVKLFDMYILCHIFTLCLFLFLQPFEATLLVKNVAHVILLGDVCCKLISPLGKKLQYFYANADDGSLIVHTELDGTLLLFPGSNKT